MKNILLWKDVKAKIKKNKNKGRFSKSLNGTIKQFFPIERTQTIKASRYTVELQLTEIQWSGSDGTSQS